VAICQRGWNSEVLCWVWPPSLRIPQSGLCF
jgi:hypothetical protein